MTIFCTIAGINYLFAILLACGFASFNVFFSYYFIYNASLNNITAKRILSFSGKPKTFELQKIKKAILRDSGGNFFSQTLWLTSDTGETVGINYIMSVKEEKALGQIFLDNNIETTIFNRWYFFK